MQKSSVVDPNKLAYAAHLRDSGDTIAEVVAKTGITRSILYRQLPAPPARIGSGRLHRFCPRAG